MVFWGAGFEAGLTAAKEGACAGGMNDAGFWALWQAKVAAKAANRVIARC